MQSSSSKLGLQIGASLPWKPKLVLAARSIIVGPYTSAQEYDRHFSTTIGSGDIFFGSGEAIRFDPTSRRLASVHVHVPERPEPTPPLLLSLLAQPPTIALPVLSDEANVDVDWPDAICIGQQGEYLAGRIGDFTPAQMRVEIAQDFELVLGATVEGWILHSPFRYLSNGWQDDYVEVPGSEALAPLLVRFFTLIGDDFVMRLDDEDPTAIEELEELINAAGLAPDIPQRHAFTDALSNIIDIQRPRKRSLD